MTGAEILGLVTGAYDLVKSIGVGIIELIGKGKVDQTELARMKAEYEKAVLNLDFSLKQAGIWMQEKLIALEQATADVNAAYAVLAQTQYRTDTAGFGGEQADRDYQSWGNTMLKEFKAQLKRFGRGRKLKISQFYQGDNNE